MSEHLRVVSEIIGVHGEREDVVELVVAEVVVVADQQQVATVGEVGAEGDALQLFGEQVEGRCLGQQGLEIGEIGDAGCIMPTSLLPSGVNVRPSIPRLVTRRGSRLAGTAVRSFSTAALALGVAMVR